MSSKVILITGASTGFGRDTVESLARAGHTVFASMRNIEGKNRAHAEALGQLASAQDYGAHREYFDGLYGLFERIAREIQMLKGEES